MTALAGRLVGRTFLHPAWDYLLVGGGASLLGAVVLLHLPGALAWSHAADLAWVTLLANSAHFASSTVRLYAKPGARTTWPVLSMVFPLVSLAVVVLCLARATTLAPALQSLYLSWSPYHYAAQAFGLAVMYAYRSGCLLSRLDKNLLWWTCMLPFLQNFLLADGVGVHWILPASWLASVRVAAVVIAVGKALGILAWIAPAALFVRTSASAGGPLPLLSILAVVSNGVWWLVLLPKDAFVWATIAHALQYLVIVTLFHVKDQLARPGNAHGALWHAATFYGGSFALGYGLFNVLPHAFVMAGFGYVESMLVVIAAINLHHFIVDAFIWRLKRSDPNRRIVDEGLVPA